MNKKHISNYGLHALFQIWWNYFRFDEIISDLMKLKRVGKKTTPEQKKLEQEGQGQQKLRGEAFISRFAGLSTFLFLLLAVQPTHYY